MEGSCSHKKRVAGVGISGGLCVLRRGNIHFRASQWVQSFGIEIRAGRRWGGRERRCVRNRGHVGWWCRRHGNRWNRGHVSWWCRRHGNRWNRGHVSWRCWRRCSRWGRGRRNRWHLGCRHYGWYCWGLSYGWCWWGTVLHHGGLSVHSVFMQEDRPRSECVLSCLYRHGL